MLGTGSATVTQIFNTCFVLQTDTTKLLVDAGGGNGVLSQLKKVNVSITDIHHLFPDFVIAYPKILHQRV